MKMPKKQTYTNIFATVFPRLIPVWVCISFDFEIDTMCVYLAQYGAFCVYYNTNALCYVTLNPSVVVFL